MKNYILSVIIPTKNRQYYCLESVKQILNICGEEVEIIVQDNSDNPTLKRELEALNCSNIIYNYIDGVLSFVDNFDAAIRLASGEYTMIIGDDDGITSLAIKLARWAKEKNIPAIKPALNFVYFWPDSKVQDNDNGVLDIYSCSSKLTKFSSREGLVQLLGNSCQDYLDSKLVKLYHGIVRRETLEKIRSITGRYVSGLSPDIYLSVALSLLTEENIIEIDVPITISGICKGSGSSQSATGEHTGRLEDAPHFRGHTKYDWDIRVPRFYSVETIWADSALAAIKDINGDYIKYYKSETLVYRSLRKYSTYKKEIMNCYIENGGNVIKLLSYVVSRGYNKIVTKITKKKSPSTLMLTKSGLTTIKDASIVCESWLSENINIEERL